jgi:hypothetical protein
MSYLAPCLADHPIYQKRSTAIQDTWHIHRGTVALYIVGPGPTAMHRASDSYYFGKIGTDEEWQIARRALGILRRTATEDAGPEEIKAALEKAADQIANGITDIREDSAEPSDPQPNIKPQAIATQEDARRVLAAVEFVTGIPARDMHLPTRNVTQSEKAPRVRAKSHACLALMHLFPGSRYNDLDDLLGFVRDTTNRSLVRHRESYIREAKYAANHATILAKLSPA